MNEVNARRDEGTRFYSNRARMKRFYILLRIEVGFLLGLLFLKFIVIVMWICVG